MKANQTDIIDQILCYLVEHPYAQDTVEGITQWWLLEQQIKLCMAEVQQALTEMINREWIVKRVGQDLQTYYKVNDADIEGLADLINDKCWQKVHRKN